MAREVADLLPLVEAHLARVLQERQQPRELYEPARYLLQNPGKRIRPLLVVVAWQLYRTDLDPVLDVAAAVELFHNFSLAHDDIMDGADQRRGQPSLHKRWDVPTAILAGDALFAWSMDLCLRPLPQQAGVLGRCFAEAGLLVCEGQAQDMALTGRQNVGLPEYLEMIRKKTAVLLGASLQLGALAADAPPAEALHLRQYGEALGMAFQIQDDLLDVYGHQTGKTHGGDILENKNTVLRVLAQQHAQPHQQQQLAHWFALTGPDVPGKVEAVLEVYDDLNLKTHAEALMGDYYREAEAHLGVLPPQRDLKPLHGLVALLTGRTR